MRKSMRGGALGAALIVALAVPGLASCSKSQTRATVDCGKSSLRIAVDLQNVKRRTGKPGPLTDATRRQQASAAVVELQGDIGELSSNKDQRQAAADLKTGATDLKTAIDHGRSPDLGPVGDAWQHWTKGCGKTRDENDG